MGVRLPAVRVHSLALRACIALTILFWFVGIAGADTVWIAGESSPIFGIVKSSDETSILFHKTTDGASFEPVTISRDTISSIVINFDAQRISSLVHGDWKSWQDYAEELFSQKQDPVARNLATRLLVIVAGNSKDAQQRNAALNDLISLASDDMKRKKLLAVRYLETGQKRPGDDSPQPMKLPGLEARNAAAQLVRSIRQRRDVRQQLTDKQLQKTVSAFAQTCSWQELVQLANSNRIDDQGFRRLVALEYELRMADSDSNAADTSSGSWHLQANRISSKTFSLPTIHSATGFDPEENRFIDGQWEK